MSNVPNQSSGNMGIPPALAVVSPPSAGPKKSFIEAFKYTAGGGLFVGVVIGFLVISGADTVVAKTNAGDGEVAEKLALATPKPDEAKPEKEVEAIPAAEAIEREEPKVEEVSPPAEPTDSDEEVTSPVETTDPVEAVPTPEVVEETKADPVEATPDPEPVAKELEITFDVSPSAIKDSIAIQVDGEDHEGGLYHLRLDPGESNRKVTITAKADGFRSFSKKVRMSESNIVVIQMKAKPKKSPLFADTKPKKKTVGNSKTGKGKGKGKKKRPGSLISL